MALPLRPRSTLTLILTALVAGVVGAGCKNDYGIAREVNTDSFVQPAREGGVDILWVIDDSASMYEEQAQLEAHIDSFTSYLSALSVDFRLAVTSTDMEDEDEAGQLLGEVLTPETPGLAAAFAEQIFSSSEGSRDERGFEAAVLAAEPGGAGGPDFAREGADLEVVFFSDEDDSSTLGVDELLDELGAVRGGEVVLNAIVGDPPEGCASLEAAADAGEKYIAAQEQSDGARESICALDYDAMLERMALQVLGLDTRFALSAIPDPATLEVRVDTALISPRERHGWSYAPGDNTIVFDGYAVPRPGAEIVVRYYDWLGPEEDLEAAASASSSR